MGGTGANHIAVGTGLAIYYTDGNGNIATPPANEIENPNPQPGTNNYYTQDGYSAAAATATAPIRTSPGVDADRWPTSQPALPPGPKCTGRRLLPSEQL